MCGCAVPFGLNVRRTRTRRPNNCVDLRQRRTHGTRAPRRPSSQLDAKAIILVRVKPRAAHTIRHAANVVTPSARILYKLDEIVHVTRAIVLDALPDEEGGS